MSNSSSLFQRARDFARAAHEGQRRHDGSPYYTHPEAVAELLRAYGQTDDEVLAAALLHDVIEDTPVDERTIREAFGERVARLVVELTHMPSPSESFEAKHRALAESARRMSPDARWIKLADRLHNLTQMSLWSKRRQERYARATAELLEALKPWPSEQLASAIQQQIEPFLSEPFDASGSTGSGGR